MGKIVVSEFVTLDGVMEAPGGEDHPDGKGGWTTRFFDEEAGAFKGEELNAGEALLLGRVTYEHFASVWPTITDDYGFAERMNSLPKFVASTTLQEPLTWNATLLAGDFAAAIGEVKSQCDGDILVFGSAGLVGSLVEHGLVDEYRLMVFPVILGSGKRLFPDRVGVTDLKLVDTKTTGSGVAILTLSA
ncbi:MAG TPA: dihydrofolate reductase family protein [Gaiellaceae bacterium]|nr:dihydrofolate reductase family protein [Gaiellaceae bacterium]